jgi:DNA repair protein SbcC/Rad50
MQIKLKKLIIINFKGIESLTIDMDGKDQVALYGANGSGKSSIDDAINWLLFGKNAQGLEKFSIKRHDSNGAFIKKIDTEVEGIFDANGEELSIRRALIQNWVKKRGSLEEEYKGDVTNFYWNDVPKKESEFKEKIKDLIGSEKLFKLLTNPLYFNFQMDWKERREILMQLSGGIQNDEIFADLIKKHGKEMFIGLIAAIDKKKSIDDYRDQLVSEKNKLKQEIETVQPRIDEVKRSIAGLSEYNFKEILAEIKELEIKRDEIQALLNDEKKQRELEDKKRNEKFAEYRKAIGERQNKMIQLDNSIMNIEYQAKQYAANHSQDTRNKIRNLQMEITSLQGQIKARESILETDSAHLENIKKSRAALLEEYNTIDAESMQEFNYDDFKCPTCKRELETSDVELKKKEISDNFNQGKNDRMQVIVDRGSSLKKQIPILQDAISKHEEFIFNNEQFLGSKKADLIELENLLKDQPSDESLQENYLKENSEYQKLISEKLELENQVIPAPENTLQSETNSQNNELIADINASIVEKKMILAKEDQIKSANERIQQLMQQEETVSKSIMQNEGNQYAVLLYSKARVEILERKINGMFKAVRFKMFIIQNNGGEKETCDTLVNTNGSWVPFSDANNAGRINAGLDIINTLCEYHKVSVPVIIDNRESVTQIIPTQSQVVNLIVSSKDKTLRAN